MSKRGREQELFFCPPSQFTQAQLWNAQAPFPAAIKEWLFIQIQAVPQGHCKSATPWNTAQHRISPDIFTGKGKCRFKPTQAIRKLHKAFLHLNAFLLLKGRNNTRSYFYFFIHKIFHFFTFLTNSLGQFWKCLKFLKEKKRK